MIFHENSIESPTLGYLLRSLYSQLQTAVYGRLKQEGIGQMRPAFSPVFRFLDANGARLTDLAHASGMTKQSMAYLLEEMSQLGWIATQMDEEDRRAKKVAWTDEGKRVQERVVHSSQVVEAEWAAKVGAKAWRECRGTLENLASQLNEDDRDSD